jgi:glycosyltransferase involved in cell wall biosynthesis
MSTSTTVILIALGFVALLGTAFWSAVLLEVLWMVKNLPTARSGLALPEARLTNPDGTPAPMPSVCLIIPAYNEEASIATVARSLLKQDYPNLRVVFALDRCTDGTKRVLEETLQGDARFEVFEINHCPSDWAGKVNAVWSAVKGAKFAQGTDLIAFADADTEFDPGCIRACAALIRSKNLGLLSLMSSLSSEKWFEKLVQPVAGYELMRQFPPRRVNRAGDKSSRRAVANGQFMMFTSKAYWSFGGHGTEHIRDELLEDIALAKRVRWEGFDAAFIPAAGMLVCRMYESYAQFELGWRRIFAELAHRRPRRLRSYALQLILTDILFPTAALASVIAGAAVMISASTVLWPALVAVIFGGVSLVLMQTVMAIGCWWGRTPQYVGLLHYPGAFAVAGILLKAARDLETGAPVRWGGRTYVRAARYEGDEKGFRKFLGRRVGAKS